jgi:DNA mismatch repair protein MutS2
MASLPDLLHPVPLARLEIGLVREALGFAFAGGGSDVTDHQLFDPKAAAPSTWTPDHYERDLFLETFVSKHKEVQIGGQRHTLQGEQLHQLLQRPPSDPDVTRYRQHVLHELISVPAYRASLEQSYLLALRVRSLLGESGLGHRLDLNRRRIEILEGWRALIEQLGDAFEGARSGLSRLRAFGAEVRATESHARLLKLLELEDGCAAIDVRLRVGYDGQLRHFEIVRVSEQTLNPFYASQLGRLVRKLLLFVRGFRFSDAEVLSRFVDQVFEGIEGELARMFQLLGDLEFYLAALSFRDAANRHGLRVCLPSFVGDDGSAPSGTRALVALFNPLLLGGDVAPTPCTIEQARHNQTVVLTGPNSGGKTRLLQALSLTQLLGQVGFFVPAERAELVWAQAMFVSISEASHAGQREGRLGMELMRIRSVFESARLGAFVVVDELCSGTNPGEGEEIFEMVLSLLRELDAQALVSTHFLQFAQRLAASGERVERYGMHFLQVELDARQSPTYQFVPGVAQSSLAHLTASRLGVTRDELAALVARHKGVARHQGTARHSGTARQPPARPSAALPHERVVRQGVKERPA